MVMIALAYYITLINKIGKNTKPIIVPKVLIKTVLQEMHDHFGHFGIGKIYYLIERYYYWSKIIKHT